MACSPSTPRRGALSYRGAGEDYESETTSYELTVRASDGGLHSEVTVTVNVTDAQEAPAFAEGSYAFDLAENAAGVSLGLVQATDPEDETIIYSIEAGDSGGLFAIDSETGALSYQGAGEDYESGTTSYELTVRASDGGLHSEVTVAVNVTDVQEPEEVEPLVTQSEQSTPAERYPSLYGEDLRSEYIDHWPVGLRSATRRRAISADARATGMGLRWSWLRGGPTSSISGASPTGDGTLNDPYLRGIKGPDGSRIAGVSNDDGGEGLQQPVELHPDRERHTLHHRRRLLRTRRLRG